MKPDESEPIIIHDWPKFKARLRTGCPAQAAYWLDVSSHRALAEKPDESEEGGTCFLCHQPIPFNTVAPVKPREKMSEPRCEDCLTRVHFENPGVMISSDGKHFICPECAPRYDHVFPAKEWDSERGCWVPSEEGESDGGQ